MGRGRGWKHQQQHSKKQAQRRASQLVLHSELNTESKKGKKKGKKSSRYSRLDAVEAGDAPMLFGADGQPIPTNSTGEPDWVAYWKAQEAAKTQDAKGAQGDGRSDDIAERLRSTFNGEASKKGSSSSTGYNGNNYGGYTGSSSWPDRMLLIHDDEDRAKILGRYKVYSSDKDWWDIAKDHFPVEEPEKDKLYMFIPWKCALPAMTSDDPPFNPCTFTATDDYLKSRWGRSLHTTDKDWLGNHPLATDAGIPHEHTLLAVADLVRPYGLVITRARLRKGAFITGDGWMQWMAALGCNPFAMIDHTTSNVEAAEKLGLDPKMVDDLWRFEFSDTALYPSIICETGWISQGGVQTGTMGGHARLLPPRGYSSTWNLSFQLGPAEFSPGYDGPIEFPEYKKRTGVTKLSLGPIVGPDMLPFAERKNGFFKRVMRGVQELIGASDDKADTKRSVVVSDPYGMGYYGDGTTGGDAGVGERGVRTYFQKNEKFTCSLCYGDLPSHSGKKGKYAESVIGLDRVCPMCYAESWDDVNCTVCKKRFYRSDGTLPQPSHSYQIEADPQSVKVGLITVGVFRCVCGTDLHVKETDKGCALLAELASHFAFNTALPKDARGIQNRASYATNGRPNRARAPLPPATATGHTPAPLSASDGDPGDAALPPSNHSLDETGPNALDADTPPVPKHYLDGITGLDGPYLD